MSKSDTIYVCDRCGAKTHKRQGKCFECGAFGSLVSDKSSMYPSLRRKVGSGRLEKLKAQSLRQVELPKRIRLSTGVTEFDRVLNGGFVPGQVVLIGGEPGVGKSTLLLWVSSRLRSVYVSAEESPEQIKIRADRLSLSNDSLQLLAETNLDSILDLVLDLSQAHSSQDILFVDSIQTVSTADIGSSAGSIAQVQECARRLIDFAKTTGTALVIVGHVTKTGGLAGPKQLEHLVDTVLYLEGDKQHDFRILRSVKNRFGPVNEVGMFKMTGKGLSSVDNPVKDILSERRGGIPGSVLTVTVEGKRPLLLELQALTSVTPYRGNPRRTATGISRNRLEMLLAVLQKRAGLNFSNVDVYVNVSGGLTIRETSSDLAVSLALASSLKNQPGLADLVAIGEVGLLGEIKKVFLMNDRIEEARRLGFSSIISAKSVKSIREAIGQALIDKA